jgi:hypothetical protein
MMTMRQPQMDAFQTVADEGFFRRCAAQLREKYPQLTHELTHELLGQMVEQGVARARAHGFSWESALFQYLELMLAIAPNFDEVPAIHGRLHDASGTDLDRMVRLMDTTTFSEWQQAARDHDPGAWGVDVNQHPVLLDLRGEFPQ